MKTLRNTNPVRIVDVTIQNRLRPLNEGTVASLVESIKRLGLLTPISVRWIRDENDDDDLLLVAGHHRLEACRRLGWTTVQAVEFDDETDARLWEIAENLHRADLTNDERDGHIREWIKLTSERVVPSTTLNQQPHDQGHSKVARELGLDRATVREAAQLGKLTETAKVLADEAGLSRKEKLAISRVAPDKQAASIAEIKAEREHKAKLASVLRDAKRATKNQQGQPGKAAPQQIHEDDDAAVWLLNHLPESLFPELLMQLDASGHTNLAQAIRHLISETERVQGHGGTVH